MNRIKSRLFCILVALAMVVASSPGEADLINPVLNVSTPTDFSVTLEDTVTTNALVTGATAHWRVMIVQFSFGPGPADDIVVFGRHRVGPHAGDVAPNPNAMAALLLNVVPAGPALVASANVDHSIIPHFDRLDINYGPSGAGGSSLLNIRMSHLEQHPVASPLGKNLPNLDEVFARLDPSHQGLLAPAGRAFAALTVEFRDGDEPAEIATEYAEAILRSRQQTRLKGKLTTTWGSIKSRN